MGKGVKAAQPLAAMAARSELENSDLAMDRRVGVVGRVLHVLVSLQGLKGAEEAP